MCLVLNKGRNILNEKNSFRVGRCKTRPGLSCVCDAQTDLTLTVMVKKFK